MFTLTPKNRIFYDSFDSMTEIIVQASQNLVDFLTNFDRPEQFAQRIKSLEHDADQVLHETMALLHRSFITPIERGDIRRLCRSLDDIVDFMDAASSRISLYEIKTIIPEAIALARILLDASKVVRSAVSSIRNLKDGEAILNHCIEINRFENEGDKINHGALATLFKSGMDPLTVIKWKEILEDIETAIDRCEDVANVVEGIVHENT